MKINNSKKIVLTANSSQYLFHYRKLLIQKLTETNNVIYTLAPYDKSSKNLEDISNYISWKISNKNSLNPLCLLRDFVGFYKFIEDIKPIMVHSHTLRVALINSICSFFTGSICIISITGLGKLKEKKNRILLYFILNIIFIFSKYKISKWFKISKRKSFFIFQNQIDKSIFIKKTNPTSNDNLITIEGSGVPSSYQLKAQEKTLKTNLLREFKSNGIKGFIFCARLLNSKGIDTFVEMSKYYKNKDFIAFGDIDSSSDESLTKKQIKEFSSKYQNLSFKGFLENPLIDFYEKPYALIILSKYGEGMPRAVAEALILSIPVISTKNALCGVFPLETVYIAEDKTINATKKAISLLESDIKRGNLLTKLEKGRKFALKNFTEQIIVDKTFELYKNFLS